MYDLAYGLLYDALSQNSYFNITEIDNKTIYLCAPLNAYRLDGQQLVPNTVIEYYLIKADSDYIGCVTVCYEAGVLQTASFSTDIALALEYFDIGTDPITLVGYNGSLYIKSENSTSQYPLALTGYWEYLFCYIHLTTPPLYFHKTKC